MKPREVVLNGSLVRALAYSVGVTTSANSNAVDPVHLLYGLVRERRESGRIALSKLGGSFDEVLTCEARILDACQTITDHRETTIGTSFLCNCGTAVADEMPFSTAVVDLLRHCALLDECMSANVITDQVMGLLLRDCTQILTADDCERLLNAAISELEQFDGERDSSHVAKIVSTANVIQALHHPAKNRSGVPYAGCFDDTALLVLKRSVQISKHDRLRSCNVWTLLNATVSCSPLAQEVLAASSTESISRRSEQLEPLESGEPFELLGGRWNSSSYAALSATIEIASSVAAPLVTSDWVALATMQFIENRYKADMFDRSAVPRLKEAVASTVGRRSEEIMNVDTSSVAIPVPDILEAIVAGWHSTIRTGAIALLKRMFHKIGGTGP